LAASGHNAGMMLRRVFTNFNEIHVISHYLFNSNTTSAPQLTTTPLHLSPSLPHHLTISENSPKTPLSHPTPPLLPHYREGNQDDNLSKKGSKIHIKW